MSLKSKFINLSIGKLLQVVLITGSTRCVLKYVYGGLKGQPQSNAMVEVFHTLQSWGYLQNDIWIVNAKAMVDCWEGKALIKLDISRSIKLTDEIKENS